jgi:hypothetical protein
LILQLQLQLQLVAGWLWQKTQAETKKQKNFDLLNEKGAGVYLRATIKFYQP